VDAERDLRVDDEVPEGDEAFDRLAELLEVGVRWRTAGNVGEVVVSPRVRACDDLDDLTLIVFERGGRNDRALNTGGRIAIDIRGVGISGLI